MDRGEKVRLVVVVVGHVQHVPALAPASKEKYAPAELKVLLDGSGRPVEENVHEASRIGVPGKRRVENEGVPQAVEQ